MKIIIALSLSVLCSSTVFAAGGVIINSDLTLAKEPSDSYRSLYFSDGSSQQLASPWSFNGFYIYYNAIEGRVGIGTSNPTTELDVNGTVTATGFSGNGSGLANVPVGLHDHSAANITSGTMDDGRLSANVSLLNSSQTVTGAKTFSAAIRSTVAIGTAPLQVVSTTLVPNLNADMVGGKKLADLDSRYASSSIQPPPVQNPHTNIITTIDSTGYVGEYNSITIGTDGLPVISYYDQTNRDLKVAKCANTACSGTATITAVDSTGYVGMYSSIAIGTDGLPVISYYDQTNRDLKVAKCANAACSRSDITTVDSTGNVGEYTSITIGTDGLPVISYFDNINTALKVARCATIDCSGTATITTIDSTGTLGMYSSITIGTDGLPVISYLDVTNTALKVAKCTTTACSGIATITSIDSNVPVLSYSSATIGTDGLPVVSYYGYSNDALMVAKCANAACSSVFTAINTLDSTGKSEPQYNSISITIGTDGLPMISYYDYTNTSLKLARCVNTACSGTATITTVDSTGNMGMYNSITIGTDGLPVISYYDYNNADLKVAKCANQFCINNWSRR